jgi:hypothetical protein
MSVIDNAKEIVALVKKLDDIELYRKIVELEGEIIELTRAKREAELQVEHLQETLKTQEQMRFMRPFYYMGQDPVPFCPQCWETKKITVHLQGPVHVTAGLRYDCRNCKSMFIDNR